ncbi:MAG: toll/interleukin-1 receptor domain-containing protein, partial [Gallionella sp.]
MGGIFISYRREDSAGHAGRLFDRLRERFGKDRVFMDVAGIEPGVDFVEAIDRAVASCDALIVVIGRKWLTCTDAAGNRRLDDPEDFIRLETAAALRREIRVIPVLIQDAATPAEKDLPEDLLKLARRQAIEISDGHWDSDTEALIGALAKALPGETAPPPDKKFSEPPGVTHAPKKNRPVWLISAMTALVVAVGGLLSQVEQVKNTLSGFFSARPEKRIETTVASPAQPPAPTVQLIAKKPAEPEKAPEP